MSGLYELASAVWAAARFRLQRRRHLPAPAAVSRPGSHCAPVTPITGAAPPAPLRLAPSEVTPGYCVFCEHSPCRCRPDNGDAA